MSLIENIAYFHDGELVDFKQEKDSLLLLLESAEIALEEVIGNFSLTAHDTIKRVLHLEGAKSIKINNKIWEGPLFKFHDHAGIFDLIVREGFVELQIKWKDFLPKPPTNDFSIIEIKADKIWWENRPDLTSTLSRD